MEKKRPININPLSIRLPITALASITHRLSGVIVFLLIPLVLCGLEHSLSSPESFGALKDALGPLWVKGLTWILLAALLFHVLAGIRHLLADVHVGDSLCAAKWSAYLVFILTLLAAGAGGFWLWGGQV